MKQIETDRIILRDWLSTDLEPFSKMNQDPKVMEFLPNIPTKEETAEMIMRFQAQYKQHGYPMFACELKETAAFIGFVGLFYREKFIPALSPSIEIGWRLSSSHWGKGYATEAAKAVLEKAFSDYEIDEIISITVQKNIRSRRVMEKIGLVRDEEGDFQHPNLPKDHPLRWHVLYRLTKEEYTFKLSDVK